MRTPSSLLTKATAYKLVALATDLGYVVKVNHVHLHGVEDNDSAFIGVEVRFDRGDGDRFQDFWMLLEVKPAGTVSYSAGRNTQVFSGKKLETVKEMETALRNNAFLNSSQYSGNNEHLSV